MPPKGVPRNCKTCGYRHVPPTGLKCGFDPTKLSPGDIALLTKNTDTEDPDGESSEEEEEEEDVYDQIQACLEAQQDQITGIKAEMVALQGNVEAVNKGIQELLLRTPVDPPPGPLHTQVGAGGGAGPQAGPLFGGDPPPPGPLPMSSDSEVDSEESEGTRRKRRNKGKTPFSLRRHLPSGVHSPQTFDQLVGALSRLQSVHLQKIPPTPFCGNIQAHIQFLCDRTGTNINSFEAILKYDADIRARANKYGARAFVYGQEQLISQHLPAGERQASTNTGAAGGNTGGAQGGGSGKKRKNKQKWINPDPDSPCIRWNYFSCGGGSSCGRKHICLHCHDPNHKAAACGNVKKYTGDKRA